MTSPARKKIKAEDKANPVKTAIGVHTFKSLIGKSSIFIDKTLLIKEFIESSAEVLLITYPRRWGKSVNMDMLKTFFEIEVDQDGNKCLDKTKTENYKLFQGEINLKNTKQEYLEEPLHI